jgi:hypothetical protein
MPSPTSAKYRGSIKRVTGQLTGCGVRREFLEPPEITALGPQPREGERLGHVVKIDLPSVIDRISDHAQ